MTFELLEENKVVPIKHKRFVASDRRKFEKVLRSLISAGHKPSLIAVMMNQKGFRRPNGQELNASFISTFKCYHVKRIRKPKDLPLMAQAPAQEVPMPKAPVLERPVDQAADSKNFCRFVINTSMLTEDQKLAVLKVLNP